MKILKTIKKHIKLILLYNYPYIKTTNHAQVSYAQTRSAKGTNLQLLMLGRKHSHRNANGEIRDAFECKNCTQVRHNRCNTRTRPPPPSVLPRARICKPFKEPRNRFLAWRVSTTTQVVVWPVRLQYIGWRNRFLGSINDYKYVLSARAHPTN